MTSSRSAARSNGRRKRRRRRAPRRRPVRSAVASAARCRRSAGAAPGSRRVDPPRRNGAARQPRARPSPPPRSAPGASPARRAAKCSRRFPSGEVGEPGGDRQPPPIIPDRRPSHSPPGARPRRSRPARPRAGPPGAHAPISGRSELLCPRGESVPGTRQHRAWRARSEPRLNRTPLADIYPPRRRNSSAGRASHS